MPNWADNQLIVNGDVEEMDRFNNNFKNFEAIVPLGEWDYDEAIETWGCKWDINPEELEYGRYDEGDYYSFMTPWSPPTGFVKKASEKYDLRFTLKTYEPGMFYMNKEIFEEGRRIGSANADEHGAMKELFSGDDFFRGIFKDMELINHD